VRIHLIAIGGSAMHNLAIALHRKGYTVSGSDDEIEEPSRSRLKASGLLPENTGWDSTKIQPGLDAVILGMHARTDNPELLKAKELGLKIYSYPEYIYEQTKNKVRVVIGGSHGKTTITAMILHVLKHCAVDCDYLVGAQLEGFDTMVNLNSDTKIAIIEGDEYLSSPIDRRPKFHLYKPNMALISGIAWDHINVFPTFENYVGQFSTFISLIEPGGTLVYCQADPEVKKLAEQTPARVKKIPYAVPEYAISNGLTCLTAGNRNVPLQIFGEHNLMNLEGAKNVCLQLNISEDQFYRAIQSFKGASKRLELVAKNTQTAFFKDFAHSPSKLKATTEAVKKQFPDRKLVACTELHTFSSLTSGFLEQYRHSMDLADEGIVFFNPHTLAHKKLQDISPLQVKEAFGGKNIAVYTNSGDIQALLKSHDWKGTNLLMMSSGNFDGIDFKVLAGEIGLSQI